jgi:hypothetical protein
LPPVKREEGAGKLTGANGENGEWKNGTLEKWNIARLEDWIIGKSEHHSIIPPFRVFTFHFSIIPTPQAPSVFSVASCEEVTRDG